MSSQLSIKETLYVQRSCAVCGYYEGPLDGIWTNAVTVAEQALNDEAKRLRTTLGTFDDRSERNIATLIIPAQEVARHFMTAAQTFGSTVRIISGTRTYAEQDELYAIGRTTELHRSPVTKARGGHSNHNFGIAWDVGIFDAEGRYLTGNTADQSATYAALGKHIKDRVTAIEWGGDWHSFIDRPHYQLATGKQVAEIRKCFENGENLTA